MSAAAPPLSLAELEAFDPEAPERARERRFLCPRCHGDRPRDAAHRCLSLNTESGLWRCHRCGAAGKLRERWEALASRRERARAQLRRAFALPASRVSGLPDRDAGALCVAREPAPRCAPPHPPSEAWRQQLRGLQPLAGTPGAAYLACRGIPVEVARAAGVRYSPRWFGRPAVVFPVRDPAGRLAAAHGRYVDGRADPKTRTAGPAGAGTFATADAWEAEPLLLVEAPIDALSLAVVGYPALATLGCRLPEGVRWACAFRSVLIGTDADAAGDAAAAVWERALRAAGARVRRLRPEGAKDWNERLAADPAGLRAFLSRSRIGDLTGYTG